MKKKVWLILPFALILVSVLGVVAFGSLEDAHRRITPAEEVLARPDTYVRKEAKKEITVNDINDTPQKVTYAASQKRDENDATDIYVDENKIQYEVDSKTGAVVGYFNQNSNLSPGGVGEVGNTKISPPDPSIDPLLFSIAANYAQKMFPEEFPHFTKIESYTNTVAFNVSFSEPGGKDGFIKMRTINVDLTPGGALTWCDMRNRMILTGFDWSLVNDLEQSTVDAFIEKELAKEGKTIEKIIAYTLEKDEDYYILVRVHTPGTVEKIAYPLS